MKLTVLVDNHTYIDRYYLGEPAACYLIEDGERAVLFDTGYSDVFIENARRMGIDLSRVTDIVLSHGHNDHTGGLAPFLARFSQPLRLYAHPCAFLPKRCEGLDIGCPLSPAELPARVEVHLSKEPVWVSAHVRFLGEIPRVYDFERGAVGETMADGAGWMADELKDDTAISLAGQDGIFIVTGCSHSGVCNAVAAAKALSGGDHVLGVLGGFHLFEPNERVTRTIETLRSLGVTTLHPCHCTSLAVKCALAGAFDVREVGVGLSFSLKEKGTKNALEYGNCS